MTTKVCSVENCNSRHKARGLCLAHYNTELRHENGTYTNRRIKNAICSVDECDEPVKWKKLCNDHYYQLVTKPNRAKNAKPVIRTIAKMAETPCTECGRPSFSNDMCQTHYNEFKLSPAYADGFWEFVKKELNLA